MKYYFNNNNNNIHYLYWRIHGYIHNIHWYNGAIISFDCNNLKVSLFIKIINFNGIKNISHLTMLVNMITCQNFNLSYIYCIFVEKKSFFVMKNFKSITSYPNMVQIMWNGMIQYTFIDLHEDYKSFKLFLEYNCVFGYIGTLHSFSQIYFNLPLYKMKWNNFFF